MCMPNVNKYIEMTRTIKYLFYVWHEDDRKAGKVPQTLTTTQTKTASRSSPKPCLPKEDNPKASAAKL